MEPIASKVIEEGILMANCLVNPSTADNYLPIRLMNVTNEDVVLRKDTNIGQLSEVESTKILFEAESDPGQAGIHDDVVGVHQLTINKSSGAQNWRDAPDAHIEEWSQPFQDLFHRSINGLSFEENWQDLLNIINMHLTRSNRFGANISGDTSYRHWHIKSHQRGLQRPLREKILREQLQARVIQESSSPWVSPIVYVRKKDGSIRPCVDYRRLNEYTQKCGYSIPETSSCLDCLYGAKYMSSLDLQSGYWQIKVNEQDRPKTAFTSRHELYEYLVMPFGLSNAPGTFQRCIEIIFHGLQWKSVVIFLDDIILFNDSFLSHLKNLNEVLGQFTKAGPKLKPSKCHLLQQEVVFLGHVVSEAGIKPDPAKIEAIVNWPVPKNVHDIRVFVGFLEASTGGRCSV